MPTYITEWDPARDALVEVVGGTGWLEAITATPTLTNLGDTLIDAATTVTQATSHAPHTVAGTPTVVLF